MSVHVPFDLLTLYSDELYHCPNSKEVLIAMPHDDKVMCACGRQNPNNIHEEAVTGSAVHHYKAKLKKATLIEARAWIKNKQRTEGMKG